MNAEPHDESPVPGERDLIARVRAGVKDLFHELIRPYERSMYGIAFAVLRNPADAEEVAQDAAFHAFLHLDQLQHDEKFKSWLLRITLNEAQMRRRKERRHLYQSLDAAREEPSDFRPKSYADWRDLPDESLDREELRSAVRNAVAQLPEKYRVACVLADGQGLSYEEIARTLDLTLNNVKIRVHRARLMLQEHLGPAFKPRMSDHLQMLKGMNPWSRARK